MNPLVSIITPCFNSANFISETILSVINQSYSNWELIIIDDKSTDTSVEVINEFITDNSKIKLIKLDTNGGVANARNIGLEAAKGKYIAFLDSDDTWLALKLEKQVNLMETNQLSMTFTAYKRINEAGKIISNQIPVSKTVNYNSLLSHNQIIFSTSLTLKSVIGDLKFIKKGHEDWIFWLELLKKTPNFVGINETLAFYRIRENSVSSNKKKAIAYTWAIYREHEKLNFIQSCIHFIRYAFSAVLKRI